MVDDLITEKLKNPNCLIDAEALASHISIMTSQSGQPGASGSKTGANKSGTHSSNSNKNKVNSSS